MGIIRRILGPKSKYDRSIPYTYLAEMPVMPDDDELYSYFFSDTICGLIEYLAENRISPGDVEIRGVYQKDEIILDIDLCTDEAGKWLTRPNICKSLEGHFKETLQIQYKGHLEAGDCSYDDRDRSGVRL